MTDTFHDKNENKQRTTEEEDREKKREANPFCKTSYTKKKRMNCHRFLFLYTIL